MKPVEVVVNGTVFLINPIDPFEALAIFGDLQKDILPAVGGLFGAMSDDGDLAEASMAQAVEKLSTKLDGKQLKAWCDRLLTKDDISVEINGVEQKLDDAVKSMAFKEFTDILELLYHVIRINFAGPLKGFLSRIGLDLSQIKAAKR